MIQKKQPNNITEIFEISKHEKDILYPLYDFLYKIDALECPKSQSDRCGSLCEVLWDSYFEVASAFKSILQRILISKELSHLNHLVDKLDEYSIVDIIFAETLEGQFFISLSAV